MISSTDMPCFRITYDGPALENYEMDVHELAPALMAVGDLLEASAKALYGKDTKVKTKVIGSFKTGSFGIDFNVSGDLVNQVIDLLTNEYTTATVTLLTLVGFLDKPKNGLLWILKKLRGRRITNVINKNDSVVLYVDDEKIEVERNVFILLKNKDVRENTEKVIAPIKRDGIDAVYFSEDKEPETAIRKEEAVWYDVPRRDQDVLLVDQNQQNAFSIVSLAFKDDNKWRLSDGNSTISVSILDEDFLKKVDDRENSFTKGDILVCDVRYRQWQTAEGVRSEYDVMKVIEHIPAPKQISFL